MRSILLAVSALVTAGTAHAGVIVDEKFQNGSGAFTIAGIAFLANGANYNPCCGTPSDTSNTFVAFGGGSMNSGSATTTFRTKLGAAYTLGFDFKAIGSGVDALTVSAAGQTFNLYPSGDSTLNFSNAMFTFTGTGGSTTLSFTSAGAPNADAIIDNISVTGAAVPEPTAWALMIVGFGMAGAAMRRCHGAKVGFA